MEWRRRGGGGGGRIWSRREEKGPDLRRVAYPLSESEDMRGSDVIPKCALCNRSKYES